jgi:hypothetical protein
MRALAAAGDRAGAIELASIYEVLIEEDVELPPDRGVVDFAERLRAGWDPRDAEVDPRPRDGEGFSRSTVPLGAMRADSAGTPETTWGAVEAAPVSPVSGSRDQVWRRVGLVLAVVTLLLAALWLLGATPTHPSPPREAPAPNDSIAPGGETGATRPPSGIGAR